MVHWCCNIGLMQIFYPRYLLPCMANSLNGTIGEWVYFDDKYESGKSPGLTIPGLYLNTYFARTKTTNQ